MRLLVTGAAGMLGRATVDAAARAGHDVVGLSRAELDITDPSAIEDALRDHGPEAIVNCAAWTDVDGAERAFDAALNVNAHGPGLLARAAATWQTRLVHVSTDYVFDGTKTDPWTESDPVAPVNAYGRTKLEGEEAVLEIGGDAAVVRAAWLYGKGGKNFVETMLGLATRKDEIAVVTDQIGHPTWTGDLAGALVELAERRGDTGVFHAAGEGQCSWHDFAVEIFDRAVVPCRVLPTTSDEFPRPAARPAYSVLGTERVPGVHIGSWQDGLQSYLDERQGATR